MENRSLRHAENRTRRMLARVRALVAAASSMAGAVALVNACSTSSPGDSESDAATDADSYADGGACARIAVTEDSGDDAEAGCEVFFVRPCGFPPDTGVTYPNCQFNFNDCESLCGAPFFNCFAFGASCQPDGGIVNDHQLVVQCGACLGIAGRRPAGLVSRSPEKNSRSAIGEYFASTAHLEAASVHAFRNLQRDLVRFAAPADLIAGARRAERDEMKHARLTARIAKRHGSSIPKARLIAKATHALRSLEAVALENAVEGCVRESFAALVALEQADRAANHEIARVMQVIADDETRHAALAWSIAGWADAQLDASARHRIEAAKNKATLDLEKEIAAPPHPELVRECGVPNALEQTRLLRALAVELTVNRAPFSGPPRRSRRRS